jgi:MobA/MobL family
MDRSPPRGAFGLLRNLSVLQTVENFVMLSMATFYLRTRSGLACKKAGTNHSAYIAGVGRYSNKHEVIAVIDKNLPQWATDGRDFFQKADVNERANGRSYRSLVFAIPLEATDKTKWAEDLTAKLLGDRHAYRMAIHEDKNNPHCHLMFTERGRKDDLSPDKYFGRSNAKDRAISQKAWLVQAKKIYLAEIRTVAPSYTPSFTKEPKIGPSMKQAGNVYEANRKKRIEEVEYLRLAARALRAIDATIERLELEAQESAAGVASKSTYTPPIGDSPIPKLESPSQVGNGQETDLNSNGFVPSSFVVSTKHPVPRSKYSI